MTHYFTHRNRHGSGNESWGWVTADPDWRSPAVAYWSGWAGQDGATVLGGHPRQPDHDYRFPWTVAAEPKRNPWDAPSWCVVNALGYAVLSGIRDVRTAEEAVQKAVS